MAGATLDGQPIGGSGLVDAPEKGTKGITGVLKGAAKMLWKGVVKPVLKMIGLVKDDKTLEYDPNQQQAAVSNNGDQFLMKLMRGIGRAIQVVASIAVGIAVGMAFGPVAGVVAGMAVLGTAPMVGAILDTVGQSAYGMNKGFGPQVGPQPDAAAAQPQTAEPNLTQPTPDPAPAGPQASAQAAPPSLDGAVKDLYNQASDLKAELRNANAQERSFQQAVKAYHDAPEGKGAAFIAALKEDFKDLIPQNHMDGAVKHYEKLFAEQTPDEIEATLNADSRGMSDRANSIDDQYRGAIGELASLAEQYPESVGEELNKTSGTVARDVGEQVAKNEQAAAATELLNSMTNDPAAPQVAIYENKAGPDHEAAA